VVLLDGRTALVAHIGDCGVARLDGERIVPVTRPHTLGVELPAAPPAFARVVTRAVGLGGEPVIQRLAVQRGDVLLLSTTPWPHELVARGSDLAALAAGLTPSDRGTVLVARVGHETTQPPVRGSARPPALPWLFRPGVPLADPPERYASGTPGGGPDAEWFAEIFAGVMTDEG